MIHASRTDVLRSGGGGGRPDDRAIRNDAGRRRRPVLTRRLRAAAPVALTVVIGLLVGIGVTYVALRPDAEATVENPPSVQAIDRPAGAAPQDAPSADSILAIASRAASAVAVPASEPPTARAALLRFLEAELADRSDESFALLSPPTQRRYSSVAAWRQSRSDRTIPASFVVIGERTLGDGRVELTVRAERTPSITPFRGLVPARSVERWITERADGLGWRLRSATATAAEPELPSDADARAVAQQWVDRASACDDAGAAPRQLAKDLLGANDLSGLACEAGGTWSTTAAAAPVGELSDVTAFVAAFGPSVGRWGRAVPVSNGTERMTVVLGPLGEDWRVMGLTSA